MEFTVIEKLESVRSDGTTVLRLTLEDAVTKKFSQSWLNVTREVFDGVSVGGTLTLGAEGAK